MLSENNNLDMEFSKQLFWPCCKNYVKNLSLIFSLMDVAVVCSCFKKVAPVKHKSIRNYADSTMGSGCLPAVAWSKFKWLAQRKAKAWIRVFGRLTVNSHYPYRRMRFYTSVGPFSKMLYRKIPIISFGVVVVQNAFLVGLFSKSGLWEEMLRVKISLGLYLKGILRTKNTVFKQV